MALHDVVLGATIDGYAVEGGYDVPGGPATTFGAAQALGHVRPSVRTQGTFEHVEALVERAAQLGAGEVRLTLEWARLERRPGEHDDEALGHYLAALRAARAQSLSAVVVLCDVALPSWLGPEPWLSAWAPDRFASHAAWVATRLEDLAASAVTFRAPNAAAREGWVRGTRPPFRRHALADAQAALDGMLVAHQRASAAMAQAAPTLTRALLLEAHRDYEDAELHRDLARTGGDAAGLVARRRAWEVAVPRSWRSRRRRLGAHGLRSAAGWSSTPPFEWWLGGDDVALLAAALEHADGEVTTVELGAGASGWDAQLAVALPALAALTARLRAVHLHGLVGSTGPLASPRGLVEVRQHGGAWSLLDVDAVVARRLAGLVP